MIKKDTRQFIIETSLRLFLQKTFKEVTMQEIVETTGLSKGAFYHYFKSKEELFSVVITDFFRMADQQASASLDHISLEKYIAVCADKITSLQDLLGKEERKNTTMNFYFMIFDGLKLLPGFREKMQQQQKQEQESWEKVIKRAKQNGEIKSDLSAKHLATLFIYTGDGIALEVMLGGNPEKMKKKILNTWMEFYKSLK